MNDVVRALAISASILLPVVVLIIVVSIFAVRRGEASVRESAHGVPDLPVHTTEAGAAVAPAKAVKPAAAKVEEISVMQILLFGIGLFTVTVLALLALSLIQHM